ncbi:hypothetical protein [Nocardia yamanashiensis]|uniref:hypothetical protein n=1 Tax=Nocardia yamanashiensis TaxID=209247 RepID=UPI0012FD9CA0|nr:hypothetical protein [Nocardia yamanashiensis]
MTAVSVAPHRITARCCAALAAGSALLHAAGTPGHGSSMPLFALVNLMSLACLACAWHLWTDPRARVWQVSVGTSAVMIALHLALPAHGGHGSGAAWIPHAATGIAVCEIALALGALAGLRAGGAAAVPSTR